LFIIGGGADAPRLRGLIEERRARGITHHDRWVHDRDDLRRRLSAADLYAFPSRSEGFPNALIEAMACGLPIVATDIAGIPDIVGRGSAAGGILVPPGDPTALAGEIGRLIDDVELRGRLGRAARLRVGEHFSLDAVGAELKNFLSERGMPV
jgi:starch synthase